MTTVRQHVFSNCEFQLNQLPAGMKVGLDVIVSNLVAID